MNRSLFHLGVSASLRLCVEAQSRRCGSTLALAGAIAASLLPLAASTFAAESRTLTNTHHVRCTVILQTRSDRLYCYATNQPFRVLLREPARFANGEVFEAEGSSVVTNLNEAVPTLLDATVRRFGETNLPPPFKVTPVELATGKFNLHRVALRGRVISHEWMMYFRNLHMEVVVAQGEGRTFRANVLDYSNTRERLPVGTEVEFVGLSFLETFVESRGPEVQVDMRNLDECRILRRAPWLTLEVARRLVAAGAVLVVVGGLWLVRERHQIGRLRAVERTVRQLNADLEHRIGERTAQLASANAHLKQAEQELLKALAQEKELSELKSRFVSMVSHEFRTPLGIIMASAEILEAYLDRLPPEERRSNLQDIIDASGHMSRMMEEVLLLGRVEAGKMKCRPAPLDLAVFCQRLVDEVTSATSSRCSIELTSSPGFAEANADESLLRHIFTNLLNNAVKYSPAGSTVEFQLEARAHLGLFTVRDHGIGIPEADARLLFQAFHRGRNVADIPGTGLGMTIVKRCVELHGGRIAFESKEGHGTTFVVGLPLFGQSTNGNSDQTTQFIRATAQGRNITLIP